MGKQRQVRVDEVEDLELDDECAELDLPGEIRELLREASGSEEQDAVPIPVRFVLKRLTQWLLENPDIKSAARLDGAQSIVSMLRSGIYDFYGRRGTPNGVVKQVNASPAPWQLRTQLDDFNRGRASTPFLDRDSFK